MNYHESFFNTFDRKEGHENTPLLLDFLKETSERLNVELREKQKGIPVDEQMSVDNTLRIIPPSALYSDEDRNKTADYQRIYHGGDDMDIVKKDESIRAGSVFEMLKTAIMNKKLAGQFIVVRSSYYDDYCNGVDNVIVHKETGDIICAIDDCSQETVGDGRVSGKITMVREKNFGLGYGDSGNFGKTKVGIDSSKKGLV